MDLLTEEHDDGQSSNVSMVCVCCLAPLDCIDAVLVKFHLLVLQYLTKTLCFKRCTFYLNDL